MRIVIIHSFYSRENASGENIVVENQVEILKKNGHQVLLLSRETDSLRGKTLYEVRAAVSVATGHGWNPIEDLLRFRPDIVLVHNLFPNIGTNWMREWLGPIVAFVHNFRLGCANGLLLREGSICTACTDGSPLAGLRYACYKSSRLSTLPLTIRHLQSPKFRPELTRPDVFVALSETSAQLLKSLNLIEASKIRVLPNFIPDVYDEDELINKKRHKRWVAVGRLTREKGFLALAATWPKGLELDIIGDGPDFAAILKLVENRPEIRLFGRQSQSSIATMLPSYSGAIFPSICNENSPLVALEFLRAGLPIITLSGNAVAELVEKYSCGLILKQFTESTLAGATHATYLNVREQSTQARRVYLERFSTSAWLSEMELLMNSQLH